MPMDDRPYCRRCINTGEDQIHKEYVARDHQILRDAETENWSVEAMDSARRNLLRGLKKEIRNLRNMNGRGITSVEAEGSANLSAQDSAKLMR